MSDKKGLTQEEFDQMATLLQRHCEFDMDQWELWSFNSKQGKFFVNISRYPESPESTYIDLTPNIQNTGDS